MDQKPSYESIETENTNLKKQIETLKNAEKINYTLYDISNAVNTTRNLKELYQSIYNSLNRLMPLPNFYIAVYDNKKKTINFDYFIDEYDNDFPIIDNLEEPGCLTGEVILAGRPIFLKENMLIERSRKNKIVGTIPKIWIGVPLIIQDTVIGVICVQHYSDPEYFSHRHLEILVSVSDQIAIAIERKQILEVLEKKPIEEHLSQYRKIDPIATLVGGIAHDFNNILSMIMGYLELLSIDQEAMSDIQKNNIAAALISSKNAVKLIKQLQELTPSDISPPFDVDIYKIAANAFNALRLTTNPQIEKEIEFSENQFFVKGYEDELHQVFMNLSMNAVQAIEERGELPESFIRIYISKEEEVRPKLDSFSRSDYLHICFEDNGCGMTPKIREKAFDPTQNGLDLAVVYYIITKKHQGYIDIETTPGKGTIFHIHLPVAVKKKSNKKNDAIPQKKPKVILVIEDEDMVRDVAVKALKAFGYNTFDACNGEAGLDIFKKNHQSIDAVLLDIIMPKMSGTETFKQMLNIDPNVKVIVASGHVTNQDQKKIFSKACAYLEKPYQIMELKQILESIFE